jgi:hypothetical protein
MSDKTKNLAKQCEAVLESILGLAFHLLESLIFNRRDPQQLYSVCLFSRILELAFGCKAILEKNILVGVPVLLRSMWEAEIDLANMMKYPDYYKRMYATFLHQKLRLMKEAASSRANPFLATVREHRNPKKDMEETQAKLYKFKNEKNGPIQIRSRAKLAGKLNEYLSVYTMLCLDTHNNIFSLEDWHLDEISTNEYRAVAFKHEKADLIKHLSSIPGILLVQSKALANFLGTEGIDFTPYLKELKKMQSDVKKYAKEKEANNCVDGAV